ncbi:MAG: restriction endonuclease [Desulfobacteraceae bacterium]|nr:restriction endonuclease [Desulfobacteraceae bacterium]
MSRKNTSIAEDILSLLILCPWYVSVIVSGIVYVSLKYYLPTFEPESILYKGIIEIISRFAGIFAIFFLIPAPISAIQSFRKKALLKNQKDINSIKSLNWRDFEFLVAQAYREQGYRVIENEEVGPDGGIDLVIKKNSNIYIVQCKQWRSVKVGVKVVREMFGILNSVNAHGVIIITSGLFTQEAKNFAHNKPIDLVEGNELTELIKNSQNNRPMEVLPNKNIAAKKRVDVSAKKCPKCGNAMVLRQAKRGQNAGQQFWGCSKFPKCRGTLRYP